MVNSVVEALEQNVEHVKAKVNEQTSQAHQIATAAEEMSQTITDIAKKMLHLHLTLPQRV